MKQRSDMIRVARLGLALTTATTLVAIALTPVAHGAVTGNRVMLVSPDDNIVLIEGLTDSTTYTVTVTRGGTEIGSVTAAPADFGVAGALEINHAAAPTLCWGDPATPDIQPGDVVSLTDGTFTDSVLVRDITTGGAVPGVGSFTISGTMDPAIPLANLDVFIRLVVNGADWRANANVADPDNSVVRDAAGSWTATFTQGDTPVDGAVLAAAANPRVLEATVGFGAVPVEGGPNEITAVGPDGGDPQPAECPPVASRTLSSVSPAKLNLANLGTVLTMSGATADSTAVSVSLTDGTTTVGPIPATIAGTGPSQSWSAVASAAQLAGLNGTITVTSTHTPDLGVAGQNTKAVLKDLVPPTPPTVSPGGGGISGLRSVFISGAAGDRLLFTVGNGTQSAPAVAPNGAVSGIPFTAPFTVGPGQTVKAVAVDAADNPSAVTSAAFTQAVTPPPSTGGSAVLPLAPGIAKAKSGRAGGVKTAKARWKVPAANGAVVDGYRVRALKIRPGKSAKKVKVVRIGASKTRLKMVLPRGTYRFQVRAVSDAGKSPWSKRSNKVRSR